MRTRVKRKGDFLQYRVTQTELVAAGLDPAADPRLLRLFADGEQQRIVVSGEGDGRFDPQDSIEFYGVGVDSPFTDSRTYWLVPGNQLGLRVRQVKGEGSSSESSSFEFTAERKDRSVYFSSLRNGERENFFGTVVTANPVDQPLTLSHVSQLKSGYAVLEVALQGVTLLPHRVKVEVNSTEAGEVIFDAQSQGVARFNIPYSTLREGQNSVSLVAAGGQGDLSLVDHIRISYQHTFTSDDALKLVAPGNRRVTIGGFTSGSIRVIDVTDPSDPEEVLGAINKQQDGYAITFAAPEGGQRSLLAFTSEQRAAILSRNRPSYLRNVNADFVIITRREFSDSLRPLVALREGEGLSVASVAIEDIYDEFSFGQKTPYAVRDFLSYAKSNWKRKPRFVLLAGDASLDPKNYLGFGDFDLVPTKLVDINYMEAASDDWFSDFNDDGIAEIATGRLPARSLDQMALLVSKIISYEASGPANEVLIVADANDGFDFERASDELSALIPRALRVTQVNRGRVGNETARKALLDGLYRGQRIVNYLGHGSIDLWKGSLLTSTEASELRNESHLTFFVMMTCLNGYFHDAAIDSLSESLLKAERWRCGHRVA